MTRRETILGELFAELAGMDSLNAERVRLAPVERPEGCVAILSPESETVEYVELDKARHTLEILVRVLVADPAGDAAADPFVQLAHNAIVTGAANSSNILALYDLSTAWTFEPGDGSVTAVELRFSVVYDTAPLALT